MIQMTEDNHQDIMQNRTPPFQQCIIEFRVTLVKNRIEINTSTTILDDLKIQ